MKKIVLGSLVFAVVFSTLFVILDLIRGKPINWESIALTFVVVFVLSGAVDWMMNRLNKKI